jgi:hypothetical protein
MFVTIINDCCDEGTMNRQVVRASILFPESHISHVGVSSYSDLEAAGLIIDTLDAGEEGKGIILSNVAPRHGKAKKWPNGTPFGHLRIGDTHLFSTIDGVTLSLVHKYGLADKVEVYDIPTVLDFAVKNGLLPEDRREMITNTQFRSYEFLPRVARWHLDGVALPYESHLLSDFQPTPLAVWFVDNFGNLKTTAWAEDLGHEPGKTVITKFGEVVCYDRLKDVPNGQVGLTLGSSGLRGHRFVELVVQGQSAAEHFGAKVGDLLLP